MPAPLVGGILSGSWDQGQAPGVDAVGSFDRRIERVPTVRRVEP
jgi:hypothetical protein